MRLLMAAALILNFACGKGADEIEPKTAPSEQKKAKPTTKAVEVELDKPPHLKDPSRVEPVASTSKFVGTNHDFSVMTAHKARMSTPKTPNGNEVTNYTLNAPGAPGAVMVLVASIPLDPKAGKAAQNKALKDAKGGLVTKYKATFSSDEPFTIGSYPGRELVFTATHPKMGEMAGRSKIIMRGNLLYQVMWIGDPTANAFIAESNAVLDSFKFLN